MMEAYIFIAALCVVCGLYLLWLKKKHRFLFRALTIFCMMLFGVALLAKLHDLKECITYSLATILFTLGTEEALELKKQLRQNLINKEQDTSNADNITRRKLLGLVNPAGVFLFLLIALGFYINIKLPPPSPAYMP